MNEKIPPAGGLEKIVSWAKRRGFVMPGSEIYGGISGVYDFGPYGLALKNNIKKLWWETFVEKRQDIVGIESAILMNRKVWQASGHEKSFVDELVECKKCNTRFRTNEIGDQIAASPSTPRNDVIASPAESGAKQSFKCPKGGEHEFTEPKEFNTMFKTAETYLRPETAQGMFTDFKQVLEVSRQKIPFGMAQIGKSFRNEINTKDFLFRIREFEIAEIEYFVKSGDDEKAFDEWLKAWEDFVLSLGIKKENLEHHEHPKEGLAHYSKRTVDIQYKFPFGEKELAGVANRTDFDLKSHEEASGKDLKYFDPSTDSINSPQASSGQAKEKFWPYVIEPTLGIERLMLAVICDAFEEVPGGREENNKDVIANRRLAVKQSDNFNEIAASSRHGGTPRNDENIKEIILHFNPKIAPVKVAVLPLVKKLSEDARKVYDDLKTCWGAIEFDEAGSIGRRYRRQDEIGTPFCITVDFETLEDKKVTIRDRDTMKQERIAISELKNYLFDKLLFF